MNPKDLWIGDRLKLKITGEIGKYQGLTDSGLLLLRFRGVERAYPPDRLCEGTYNEDYTERSFWEENEVELSDYEIEDSIDLHLNSNDQKHIGNWPGAEIYYQKSKFVKYMKSAKKKGLSYVDVIHGKGSGALKSEVINLVEHWELRYNANNAGSTRIWLR